MYIVAGWTTARRGQTALKSVIKMYEILIISILNVVNISSWNLACE